MAQIKVIILSLQNLCHYYLLFGGIYLMNGFFQGYPNKSQLSFFNLSWKTLRNLSSFGAITNAQYP